MSGKHDNNNKNRNDAAVILKVLRSPGMSDEFSFNLQQKSLKDLKEAIQKSKPLGSLPKDRQRIFHLGRELKTLGRSLETLGVGNYGIYVLHIFPRPLKTTTTKTKTSKSSSSKEHPNRRSSMPKERRTDEQSEGEHTEKEVVDLANASDDGDDTAADEEKEEVCVIDEGEEGANHHANTGRKRRRVHTRDSRNDRRRTK